MIYLDNAATTPICGAAKQAIIEHLDDFGNPSSSHAFGRKAKILIEDARERIAKCINAEPDEIYFTSGGSEANTWALKDKFSLATDMEHHSIQPKIHEYGWITSSGLIDDCELWKEIDRVVDMFSLKPIDIFSFMYVNNEIGTIQPIKYIAEDVHDFGYGLCHTDAVQAVGHIPIDVKDLGVDMLSASGHKFGSLKGVGFLYVKNGIKIPSLIYGGKQEHGKRGGTENVLGIISMTEALEDSIVHMEERNAHIKWLRDHLLSTLLSIDGVHLNGSLEDRVVSNINIRIKGVKGQDVVAMANEYGICISAGSACNEGAAKPSHVLKAIGLTDEEALSSIRITIGHQNTFEEIEYTCDMLPKIIKTLRDIG